MERIFSFLLFAVFFYLMMRFGCGSHAVHGHHQHDKDGPKSPEDSRDPVCGMNVGSREFSKAGIIDSVPGTAWTNSILNRTNSHIPRRPSHEPKYFTFRCWTRDKLIPVNILHDLCRP